MFSLRLFWLPFILGHVPLSLDRPVAVRKLKGCCDLGGSQPRPLVEVERRRERKWERPWSCVQCIRVKGGNGTMVRRCDMYYFLVALLLVLFEPVFIPRLNEEYFPVRIFPSNRENPGPPDPTAGATNSNNIWYAHPACCFVPSLAS